MITSETIRDDLRRTGWCRLGPLSGTEYRELAESLGEVWSETVVELRPGVGTYLCQPGPVPPHTDHPRAHLMSWRCEESDHINGEQILVDGWRALMQLDEAEIAELGDAEIEVRVRSGEPATRQPIFADDPSGRRLCFAPWLKPINATESLLLTLKKLSRIVDDLACTESDRVLLDPGEVLIVDNRRILHGRDAIPSDCRRRLRRYWIRVD